MSRSPDEIKAQIAKLQQELAEVEIKELEADREQVVALLVKLNQYGKLPDKLVEVLSTSAGVFSPGIFIKKPRV